MEDFQAQMIAGISTLTTGQEEITKRLDRMNGSVAKTIDELTKTRIELAEHPAVCPQRRQIEDIQHKLATGDHPGSRMVNEALVKFNALEAAHRADSEARAAATASSKSTRKEILEWLKPFIIAIVMSTFFLFGLHFVELWGKKP